MTKERRDELREALRLRTASVAILHTRGGMVEATPDELRELLDDSERLEAVRGLVDEALDDNMHDPMAPEEQAAIERFTRFADAITWASDEDAAAARTVLRLAKRPYALGEEERETLETLRTEVLEDSDKYLHPDDKRVADALTAALDLVEPFTREGAEIFKSWAWSVRRDHGSAYVAEASEEEAALARLEAYIKERWG